MDRVKELISAYGLNCSLWGGNRTEENKNAALESGEQLLAHVSSLTEHLSKIETIIESATHEVLFDPTGARHVMAIDMAVYHAALAAQDLTHIALDLLTGR